MALEVALKGHQVANTQQCQDPIGVLGDAAVAAFGIAEIDLQAVENMLDLTACRALPMLMELGSRIGLAHLFAFSIPGGSRTRVILVQLFGRISLGSDLIALDI